MRSEHELSGTSTAISRHKCAACFKQYKKKEHLIEHMKSSYHSIHQPKCGVCQKHCKSFESLREHITGPLPKANCSTIFAERGCSLCLKIFDTPNSLSQHKESCYLPAPIPLRTMSLDGMELQMEVSTLGNGNYIPEAVALDCEMVGGGSDGSLELCARVCLVDEDENIIFQTYVLPQIPVTDYRYEVTGIKEEHLKDAMPLKEVQDNIRNILYNGESFWSLSLNGGKAKILVGHGLEHDLDCLRVNYPDHMLRDTSKYYPLMKTNLVSHSLKYLTRTYLGYDIQTGIHDPYEDCVSAMRLYKRMRAQDHQVKGILTSTNPCPLVGFNSAFDPWKEDQLINMTPDELFQSSRSNFRCWCLDSCKPSVSDARRVCN